MDGIAYASLTNLGRSQQFARRYGEVPFEEVDASVQGWINHVRYGNTVGLRKAIFRSVTLHASKEPQR